MPSTNPPDGAASRRSPAVLPAGLATDLAGAGLPVATDPGVLAGHATDWTGRLTGPVLGMVRPRGTAAVATVLRLAHRHSVPVQVQGGNTGLVGGSVPDRPALLLVTTGLGGLGPVDVAERTVVAGAGVTAGALAAHATAAGLRFGVDLAARDSATIGGMTATNAGGLGVLAHGMMREQVRGLTAVLADGRVLRTVGRPRKDNAGYDLAGLMVGSEGTLGVITEIEVTLHEPPAPATLGALAVDTLADAVAAARAVQAVGAPLLAAEVVDAAGVSGAARAAGVADPLPRGAPWLLLLEVADGGGGEGLRTVGDRVVAAASAVPDRARLWALRERQTELYAAMPGPAVIKLDLSVRLAQLDALMARVTAVLAAKAPGSRAGCFGHALDGNLHVQLVGVDEAAAQRTTEQVLHAVAELDGSISAEHGIGRTKARWLGLARSPDAVSWMRDLKATVDPQGLLNPGVLFGP